MVLKTLNVARKSLALLWLMGVLLLAACSTTQPSAIATTAVTSTITEQMTEEPTTPAVTATLEKRPADSDTPASGICLQSEGDVVNVLLGTGSDGLPLGGRCVQITSGQRIKLLNQSGQDYSLSFGPFDEVIPSGGELLLDLPAGDYLENGVHLLPDAPAIWVVQP